MAGTYLRSPDRVRGLGDSAAVLPDARVSSQPLQLSSAAHLSSSTFASSWARAAVSALIQDELQYKFALWIDRRPLLGPALFAVSTLHPVRRPLSTSRSLDSLIFAFSLFCFLRAMACNIS